VEVLALDRVTKRFAPDRPPAVDGLCLSVAEGEIVALLGPSGCGKTTPLRLVAGFETPDAGTVSIRGLIMADSGRSVPPEARGVGIVFQDYALFPHLAVGGQRRLRSDPPRPRRPAPARRAGAEPGRA
jgi:iron(III) transport system ATP-binding protein